MTQQSPILYAPGSADAGRELAQLRHVLALVEQIAGRAPAAAAALDEDARLSSAYADAAPVVQKRFDTLAGETATWAAAAVEALLADEDADAPAAAAAALADELARALDRLAAIIHDKPAADAPRPQLPSWFC